MAGSGIQRAVRFTQYFAGSEYEPLILTTTRWGNDLENPDWEKQLPEGLKIFRVFTLDPFRFIQAYRNRGKKQVDSYKPVAASGAGFFNLLKNIRNLMHRISIPDHAIWWAPTAVIAGIYLIVRYRPALMFATSGPYGSAMVAFFLHKLTGIKWIQEFRDPWTAYRFQNTVSARQKIETRMERACLKNASGIVATTENTTQEFQNRTPGEGCEHFLTVTNGFSPADFAGRETTVSGGIMHIVYTGMFYGERTPEYFFRGFLQACQSHAEMAGKVRITIAGTFPGEFRALAEQSPLKECLTVKPYIGHNEVLKLLGSADLLLLALSNNETGIIAAKLFEYLAARKCIFALVPTGPTAEIIDRFGAGFIIPPQDAASAAAKLWEAFVRFQAGQLKVEHRLDDLEEYSWEGLARKLQGFFEEIETGKF